VGIAVVVAAAVVYWFSPESYGFSPRCPVFMLTGLKCAGCGTLRAAHCALHGDFAQAFRFNPLLFLAVPFLLMHIFRPAISANRVVGWGVVAVVVLYSLFRNL